MSEQNENKMLIISIICMLHKINLKVLNRYILFRANFMKYGYSPLLSLYSDIAFGRVISRRFTFFLKTRGLPLLTTNT